MHRRSFYFPEAAVSRRHLDPEALPPAFRPGSLTASFSSPVFQPGSFAASLPSPVFPPGSLIASFPLLWRFACRLNTAGFLSQQFDQLSTPPAFSLWRFAITGSFKIMNSQIENNLSYLGTSFSILMAFLFMNSQIDIYDSHMGSEQRQIHWISGAALFAAQKNSRNNIKIYDVGTPKTDIVKRLQCTSHMLIFFCRMGIHECACSEEKANNPNPSPFVLDMGNSRILQQDNTL